MALSYYLHVMAVEQFNYVRRSSVLRKVKLRVGQKQSNT